MFKDGGANYDDWIIFTVYIELSPHTLNLYNSYVSTNVFSKPTRINLFLTRTLKAGFSRAVVGVYVGESLCTWAR